MIFHTNFSVLRCWIGTDGLAVRIYSPDRGVIVETLDFPRTFMDRPTPYTNVENQDATTVGSVVEAGSVSVPSKFRQVPLRQCPRGRYGISAALHQGLQRPAQGRMSPECPDAVVTMLAPE